MKRSTKDAWLNGPGDLREEDVEDVPVKGQTVRVRGLPAAYSNKATSDALELVTGVRGEQTARINQHKLEVIQFAHGCVEPAFNEMEADLVAQKYGPAFKAVIAKIDELSGVDKEAIEKTHTTFPAGGPDEGGPPLGNGTTAGGRGSDIRLRTG